MAAECWRRSAGIACQEFAFGADPYQRLLVFEAPRPDGRVLVFWHGGGWTSGYKEWMGFMAPAFTAEGVTFVSAGYRLAPQHVFPAALDDCIQATRWVAENIARHGGNARADFHRRPFRGRPLRRASCGEQSLDRSRGAAARRRARVLAAVRLYLNSERDQA